MHKALGLVAILLVGLVGGCGDKTPPQAPATSGGSDAGAKPKPKSSSATDNSANTSSKPTKSSSTAQRPAAEQQAINDVRKLNGKIEYADSAPDSPVIKVSFKSQRRVKGTDLGILKDLPTIKELDLDGTSVTDVSLVASLPKLRILYLPDLAPDQFAKLAELPSLLTLSVGIAKPSLESAGIDNRFKNRSATKEFESQDFVGQALGNLSRSRTLRHLRVTQGGSATLGAGWLRADSFAPLQRCPSLAFLEFQPPITATSEKADLEWAAYDQIAHSRTLDTLIVTKQMSGDCMARIATCKALQRLAVALPPQNGDGIVRTAAAVPSLTHLNITTGGQTISDTLMLQLKRERTGLTIVMKKADWWDDCVATSRKAADPIPATSMSSDGGTPSTPDTKLSLSGDKSETDQTNPSKTAPAPIVGRWNNVTSKGWAMEFLATGEALNIDPKGVVDGRGTWKNEGNGRFSARLGQNNEWEWRATVQGDTLVVEALLNGKPHSKSTFSRK